MELTRKHTTRILLYFEVVFITVYILEEFTKLSKKDNTIIVENNSNIIQAIPLEMVSGIVLIDKISITSTLIETLLKKNIVLTWIQNNGKFIGQLENTHNYNIIRQDKQFKLYYNDEKRLELSKCIIKGKIHNQREVLKRYYRNKEDENLKKAIDTIKYYFNKIDTCDSIRQIMGYEGYVARTYYSGIGTLLPEKFHFEKRTKQPPEDPFNSLISFGYTLLMYEFFNGIKNKGGNPYTPFMHDLRNGHPALCSDLMEEWRPILVDTIAINMLKNGELNEDNFYKSKGGVYLEKFGMKKFLYKYENKMKSSHKFSADEKPYTYRRTIENQIQSFFDIVSDNKNEYVSILIR